MHYLNHHSAPSMHNHANHFIEQWKHMAGKHSFKSRDIIVYLVLSALISCSHNSNSSEAINIMPPFKMLLVDKTTQFSSTQIPVGTTSIFIYFSPSCNHCQQLTKMLVKNIQSLKESRIYLLTPMSYDELKHFFDAYHLADYKNITVGTDFKYSFYKIFKPTQVPYIVIYNGNGKLIKEYKKGADITDLIKDTRS